MHRAFIAFVHSFPCLSRRCFSITTTAFTWNPIRYAQSLDLGRQAFRAHAVQTLIDQYPDLTVGEVNDVANGLTYENHVSLKLGDSPLLQSERGIDDIIAKIGDIKRKNDDSALTEILEEIKSTCLLSLSPPDTHRLIKSQHPRFLLRHFCDLAKVSMSTSSEYDNGVYSASVCLGKDIVCTETNEIEQFAINNACLSAIRTKFVEEFDKIQLKDFDEIPLERDVDIGMEHKQRIVTLTKTADDGFGFTICGGQQKIIKNEEYVQLSIITPIIISKVMESSPAESCGLLTGDVLIGVNDHNLTNKTHKQAVISLNKFVKHEEVSFTVLYNKRELLKHEAEQRILQRELSRVKSQINSKGFAKWHKSKSKQDPMEYFMEMFVEKKRLYTPKLGGNKNRLWHQYKPIKKKWRK